MPAGVDANFAPGKNFLQDSLREAEGLLRRLPRGETLRGQIDALVYDLYLPAPRLRQAGALTPAEIKIVEGAAK
jgi:hypothetical protein